MNLTSQLRRFSLFSSFVFAVLTGYMLLSIAPTPASAQATSTSAVTGLVTDQSGAAVPGVKVTLTDPETSTVLTTNTNTDGRYAFATVNVGTYNITFEKQGFAVSKVQQQKVDVGTTLNVNTALQVGATTTTVEVQAQAAAELQTTSASVGTTITSHQLQDLPNLARDAATLAVLQPGITPGGSTAGSVQDQNSYTVDGGMNSDDMAGNSTSYVTNFTGLGGAQTGGSSAGAVPVPVESIEEFKVTTFNQGADFNGGLGSQVQMVTKRGTNQFHGSLYEYYFATNVGAANSWTNDHTCAPFSPNCTSVTTPSGTGNFPTPGFANPLPSNHRNRFGTSIGGPFAPNFLGGKWYFFFNYEGQRFPNNNTYEHPVPSDLMRAGVIQVPIGPNNVYTPFNLNPGPVTVDGVTYPGCGGASYCDPRGIGISPLIKQIWNTQMPTGNDLLYSGGDQHNVIGYLSTLKTPLTDDIYTGRIDHDFTDKWHFFGSYRFMRLVNLTSNQVDIGGALPGDRLGVPAAVAPRDQLPSLLVGGLTTVISATMTNDFRYSYTRNFWQWGSVNAPPEVAGLGGAVEIAPGTSSAVAESSSTTAYLNPYNVNTQSVRQRFWDGHDQMYKDDVSKIWGNHILQFGGQYLRNYDFHMRTDNGNGVNNAIVYQVGSNGVSGFNYPAGLSSSNQSAWQRLYSETLGFVSQSQVAYTRAGTNLAIQPIGSVAYERSIIPTYSLYAADSWHLKPTLTLTYGLSWEAQLPPYELNGAQVMAVDANGKPITASGYLAAKQAAALAGQVYNPVIGFETIRGVGRKYPYNPVWNQFSPRVAVAWNPKFGSGLLGSIFGDGKTVIRGGYGRIYGRLNGVDLVLVPLLGPGLLQAVSCVDPTNTGVCNTSVTPANAFRVGPDGLNAPLASPSPTLAQPFYPGINGNPGAQDPSVLDPNFRPESTDNFTFSIQRAIGSKMTFETGYIGRLIHHEVQNVNIDAVPYMTTLGGQAFSTAYANIYLSLCGAAYCATAPSAATVAAVPVQPFIEAALGGPNSTYCKGATSCTAKFVAANVSNWTSTSVSTIWRNLNTNPSWVLPQSMMDVTQSITSLVMIGSGGYGNYNALYGTFRTRDFHGLSTTSNFTWGRALGTGAVTQASSAYTQQDAFNINANYGINGFDIKFLYNMAVSWETPWYKTQHGIIGHVLGGWIFSSIFTAQSAGGEAVGYNESGLCGSGCQAFGESSSSGVSSLTEEAVAAAPYTGGGTTAHYNVAGSNGIGTNNPTGVNQFANPAAVYSEFRPCILGYDTSCGGYYNIRGLPWWNVDAGALKDIGVWKEGRVGATLSFQITNVMNHEVFTGASSINLSSQTLFGRITGAANIPRNMEFGLRIHF